LNKKLSQKSIISQWSCMNTTPVETGSADLIWCQCSEVLFLWNYKMVFGGKWY